MIRRGPQVDEDKAGTVQYEVVVFYKYWVGSVLQNLQEFQYEGIGKAIWSCIL